MHGKKVQHTQQKKEKHSYCNVKLLHADYAFAARRQRVEIVENTP